MRLPRPPSSANPRFILASAASTEWDQVRDFSARQNRLVARASSVRAVLRLLKRSQCAVILTETALEDGTWRDLLGALSPRPDAPEIVVIDRNADDALWLDVLDAGGFDLLRTPLEERDLAHAFSLAEANWLARISAGVRGLGLSAAGDR